MATNDEILIKFHIIDSSTAKRPSSTRPTDEDTQSLESQSKKLKKTMDQDMNGASTSMASEINTHDQGNNNNNFIQPVLEEKVFDENGKHDGSTKDENIKKSETIPATTTTPGNPNIVHVYLYKNDEKTWDLRLQKALLKELIPPPPSPYLQYFMLFLLLLCSGILLFQFVYLPLASEFHLEQASFKIIKNPQNALNNDTVQQQQQQQQPQLDEKNNSKSIAKPIPIVEINCQIAFISQVQKYVNHEYLQKKFSKHVRSLQNEKISLSFSKLSSFEELNSNTSDYFLFITTDSRTEASDAKGYLERNVIPRIQEHFDITKSSIIYTTSDSQLISKIPNLPVKNYYVQWTSDVDKVGKQGEEPLKEMTNDFVKSCRENRQRAIQESSHKKTTPFRKNKYSKTSRGGNSKSKRRNGGG